VVTYAVEIPIDAATDGTIAYAAEGFTVKMRVDVRC
jgi:hypothetical protein